MKVYWRHRKRGQNLVLSDDNEGNEEEIGGFRESKRSIDAYAKTFSYDPGRSEKGFPTVADAKAFVEHFRPWELFDGTQDLAVEHEVRPALDPSPSTILNPTEQTAEVSIADQPVESLGSVEAETGRAEFETKQEPVASVPKPRPVKPEPQSEPVTSELQKNKQWWEFWKNG